MKQLSQLLPNMPNQSNDQEQQSNMLHTLQRGLIKSDGKSITISNSQPRELPLSRDQEKAIRSSWEQKSQCVELWKPIILEGKTRYQENDYLYVYHGDKSDLMKSLSEAMRPASQAAKLAKLTLLAMHRPMKEASNQRIALLLEDYAFDLGDVSELALADAVDDLKRDGSDETGRWFPMIGEIQRAVKRHERQLLLLANASSDPVPEGYMRAGQLSYMTEEIVKYDGFTDKPLEIRAFYD